MGSRPLRGCWMIVKRLDPAKRFIVIVPENSLDLINVFRLVRSGDVLYSKTSRELKKERASGKIDSERVQVVLGIEVESKTADPLMRRVRFSGRIVYESRKLDLLGKYHTITVLPGVEVKLESRRDFERLRAFAESYKRREKPIRVVCVSLDDEELAVAEFSNRGLNVLYSKHLPRVDKSVSWSEQYLEDFFEEAVSEIKKLPEGVGIIVLGPRIFSERFLSYLKRRGGGLSERVLACLDTSIGGEAGVREVLKLDRLPEFLRELKPFRDSAVVERFIGAMSRDPERVAIGLKEVYEAWKLGAVEMALVAEPYLWSNLENEVLGKLLEAAERGKLNLQVILDGLEASDKIMRLGGVVALLRYRLPLKRITELGRR